MKKRILALVLAMVFVFLSGVVCATRAEDYSFLSSLLETSLSPEKKCPA